MVILSLFYSKNGTDTNSNGNNLSPSTTVIIGNGSHDDSNNEHSINLIKILKVNLWDSSEIQKPMRFHCVTSEIVTY